MREVELKSVVADPDAVVAALRAAGATLTLDGRLGDARYDTAAGALTARDEVLRLRLFDGAPGPRASLEWKGPTREEDGYKVRDEVGTAVEDGAAAVRLLHGLGYVVVREIDRRIMQFACRGAAVRVERYPRMDALVEVEGEPAAIEAAITATGLPRAGFTAERLRDFVRRFEARSGHRAALCDRELAGDYRYAADA
jgi:adenylate cyclase class IV